MDLKEILAISGKPGLYKLVAQSKNGVIVEALADKKRFPISAQSNVSALADIAIYTYESEVPLADIFKTIYEKENGGQCVSHKDSKEAIFTYFSDVVEGFDDDRVYISDMKKVFQWYNILQSFDLLSFEEEKEEEEVDNKTEE